MTLDLDALEAARLAATPPPWKRCSCAEPDCNVISGGPADVVVVLPVSSPEDDSSEQRRANADYIVSLVNAAPALLARLRAAEALLADVDTEPGARLDAMIERLGGVPPERTLTDEEREAVFNEDAPVDWCSKAHELAKRLDAAEALIRVAVTPCDIDGCKTLASKRLTIGVGVYERCAACAEMVAKQVDYDTVTDIAHAAELRAWLETLPSAALAAVEVPSAEDVKAALERAEEVRRKPSRGRRL